MDRHKHKVRNNFLFEGEWVENYSIYNFVEQRKKNQNISANRSNETERERRV